MSKQPSGTILVVDDKSVIRDFLQNALSLRGYNVILADNAYKALEIFEQNTIEAVITDVRMPRMSGVALLKKLKKISPGTPVVVITGYGTVNGAVETMKYGASDYLSKPFSAAKLYEVLAGLLYERSKAETYYGRIITSDPQMRQILETVNIVADSNASVFINGESGTGKELIARAIHDCGNRRNERFVSINCAALPEALLESELFGHEQGAFTGAIARQIGKFELAHSGTLLLDEIAEMAPALQAKLLRCLQEREIDRIGGSAPIKVDVRVIAITNKDIKKEIEEQRFRSDLYYRLNVVPITVPPLRERRDDIRLLANHFLDEFSRRSGKTLGISEDAMEALEEYDWPGNVRELENLVENVATLCRNDALSVTDFFPHDLPLESARLPLEFMGATLQDAEKYLIISTLEKMNGNQTRAAKILGITPRTIRNKLRKYMAEEGKTTPAENKKQEEKDLLLFS